jgi:predicted ATPase
MKIESLELNNFKAFKNAKMDNISRFCVIVGANGTGKSTIFSVFSFLHEAMIGDVSTALNQLGGLRGFQDVRSRGSEDPIKITIKFRSPKVKNKSGSNPLITYILEIDERPTTGQAFIKQETLQYRRGRKGQPWKFLDFSKGSGNAVTNELEQVNDDTELVRETQKLKSDDILAIKGLAQFEKFPAVVALGALIEKWHISDLHIDKARPEKEVSYAEHLSQEGDNLSIVIQYLYKNYRPNFNKIIDTLKDRIPGLSQIESKVTEEGRVLLKFQDGAFEDPFLARNVSDGTIKMLAYLVLLHDPNPHPLLCIEEPENQLYHSLLEELAEEFREYANRGEQVFVSTHSPDFLNAVNLDEVFWLEKQEGYTSIVKASEDSQIAEYMKNGDKMGYLWKQGFFGKIAP